MVIDRIPSRYSNRLRRTVDRLKEGLFTLDSSYIDLDTADQTEDVSPPDGEGQFLIRLINSQVVGTETYTITFITNDALTMDGITGSGPETFNTAIGNIDGDGIFCMSGYYASNWVWIRINSGFSLSTV